MIPLFSSAQNREADNYAINKLGIPGPVLMENASRSIYEISVTEFDLSDTVNPVGFLIGKGNNGGDGLAVARHFVNAGFRVTVVALADETTLTGDALLNYKVLKNLLEATKSGVIVKYKSPRDLNKLRDCSVIYDALLGTGAKGALREPYRTIIEKINLFNTIKIAIDVPTGLNADTGFGETVFNAHLTVSLGEFKRGLFIESGKAFAGKVVKGYIGIGEEYFDALETDTFLIEPEDAFLSLPKRKKNLHKYSAGKVLTIAGSPMMTGAAIFTASSAFYVGAGASVLAIAKGARKYFNDDNVGLVYFGYGSKNDEVFNTAAINDLSEKIAWADAVALGPGLGRAKETTEAVKSLVQKLRGKRVILDADGLYPFNNGEYENYDLRDFVLTPHHGEFAALLGISVSELQKDLLGYGKRFVEKTGAWLVLKGAPTIVFSPEGEAFVNSAGNSGMAKFGSGDVLTGTLAGVIAQSEELEDAIISAVYLHSLSADLLAREKTEYGLTAKDIMRNLPQTIGFLNESFI
jgi:NAD(P)H-hydrate epimerase